MTHHYSSAGTHHLKEGRENQDAFSICSNDQYSVMVLADGVSTCTHAGQGAQLACDTASQLLLGCADYFLSAPQELIPGIILRNILHVLGKWAETEGVRIEEYSSTLSFVLHDRKQRKLLLFQLGDGLIIGSRDGRCICLLQPGDSTDGACVTTTHLAERQCGIRLLDADQYQALMLLTDGAWQAFTACGNLRQQVQDAFLQGEYHVLQNLLQQAPPMDDHSFLILTTS